MRFLRITEWGIFAKADITKQDLVDVQNKTIVALIDTDLEKWFDAESNEWKDYITG